MAFFTNEDDKKLRRKEESTISEKLIKMFEFTALTADEKEKLL
jgi:hypothetical protein